MIRFSPRVSALAAVVILTPAMAGCGINAIPTKEEAAKAKWADVQSQYQRRADLVPNLVATVQGAKDFEAGTLTNVTQARSMSVQANNGSMGDKAAADGMLTAALGKLFAVAEAYPQLTATANFQQLQGQLSEIEGQLQFSRQYYNDSVVALNTAVRTIPSMWFTGLAKVDVREMYNEPDEGRRSAPQVQF